MSTMPNDQFWGMWLMVALFSPWFLEPIARRAWGHLVARVRIARIHHRQSAARRTERATTTYYLGTTQISREEYEALRHEYPAMREHILRSERAS